MSDDAPIPTEDEILVGDKGGFSIEQWAFALKAGKYDGHLIEMAAKLSQRAMIGNRRRWRIRWRDDEVTEDTYTLTAASFAEDFSGLAWGVLNVSMGHNVQMNAKVAQALLYGMARTRFGMNDQTARKAVGELPSASLLEVLDYYEVEPVGKGDSDQLRTT